MIVFRPCAALAAAAMLCACASRVPLTPPPALGEWRTEVKPAKADCPAMPPEVKAEARRVTSVDKGGAVAGSALASEMRKNAALDEALRRYEACRKGGA